MEAQAKFCNFFGQPTKNAGGFRWKNDDDLKTKIEDLSERRQAPAPTAFVFPLRERTGPKTKIEDLRERRQALGHIGFVLHFKERTVPKKLHKNNQTRRGFIAGAA